MSDWTLSTTEMAILRMLRTTGGVPATKIVAPWRSLEQLVRANLVSVSGDESLVTLTSLGQSVVARLTAEEAVKDSSRQKS